MTEPPLEYAKRVKNDTACFEALVDPMPATHNLNNETGFSSYCDEVKGQIEVVQG